MTLIQLLLLPFLVLLLIMYAVYFKNALIKRISFMFIFGLGIVFVLFPNLTNDLARWLGVGRGADLLLYLITIIFYFSFIILYNKIKKNALIQTDIIRGIAIQNARNSKSGI